MNISGNILELTGKTPLVKLNRQGEGLGVTLPAKVESFNPGGAVKDRLALAMIVAAEKEGKLDKDTLIIEPTSGNTGIGLAMVCSVKGYRLIIGSTCIIGNHVKLYQGVTLGAKSFEVDSLGNPVKGIPRHPVVEDNVVIYAGATILGRVTTGKGSIIGGNVRITRNVPAGSRTVQEKSKESTFSWGAGI